MRWINIERVEVGEKFGFYEDEPEEFTMLDLNNRKLFATPTRPVNRIYYRNGTSQAFFIAESREVLVNRPLLFTDLNNGDKFKFKLTGIECTKYSNGYVMNKCGTMCVLNGFVGSAKVTDCSDAEVELI